MEIRRGRRWACIRLASSRRASGIAPAPELAAMLAQTVVLSSLETVTRLFGEAAVVPGQLFGILFVPFWSIALTLLYFDLRTEKEGFSIESLGALMSNEQ